MERAFVTCALVMAAIATLAIGSPLRAAQGPGQPPQTPTPLSLVELSPAANETAAPRDSDVRARFTAQLAASSVTSSSFVIHGAQSGRRLGASHAQPNWLYTGAHDASNKDAFFAQASSLAGYRAGERVDVTLTSAIADMAGVGLDTGIAYSFRAAAAPAPATFDGEFVRIDQGLAQGPAGGFATERAVAGDLDGDGNLDMICKRYQDSRLRVLCNDGRGDFLIAGEVVATAFISAESLGDLDGDGDLDLVVVYESAAHAVYYNDGTGGFDAANMNAFGRQDQKATSLALGDVNADGWLDVAIGAIYRNAFSATIRYSFSGNTLHLNDGTGTLGPVAQIIGAGFDDNTFSIGLADLNGDGALDAVAGNGSDVYSSEDIPGEDCAVYLNGGGRYAAPYIAFGQRDRIPRGMRLADFDGDGHVDVALALWHRNGPMEFRGAPAVYYNDGSGDVTHRIFNLTDLKNPANPASPHNGSPWQIDAGDLDGDGALDLVSANCNPFDGYQDSLFLNDGSGAFHSGRRPGFQPSGAVGGFTRCIVLGDFDGDADLDMTVCTAEVSSTVYFNGARRVAIASITLPRAYAGVRYQATLAATAGLPPYSWSATGLPAWLSLDQSTGTLSGIPPAALGGTSISFGVRVTENAGNGAGSDMGQLSLNIVQAAPLPWSEDFENAISGNGLGLVDGANARARISADAASAGGFGLLLDAVPGGLNWPLSPAQGQVAADDPAQWMMLAPTHVATAQTAIRTGVAADIDITFDLSMGGDAPQSWYSNLVVQWSEDSGQTWQIAAGAGAGATMINGIPIYRGDHQPWMNERIELRGIVAAQGILLLRFVSLMKFSYDDTAGLRTWAALDSISVIEAVSPPIVPPPTPVPPVLAAITPNTGSELGDDIVVLNGAALTGASVTIGGLPAIILSNTDVEISARTPAHAAGVADIVVTTPDGAAQLVAGFTYLAAPAIVPPVLASIAPNTGSELGGDLVVLNGTGLAGATVSIGGLPSLVISNTGSEISARTPAHAAGAADVVITTPGGTAQLAAGFTYLAAPLAPPQSSASIEDAAAAAAGCALDSTGEPVLLALVFVLLILASARARTIRIIRPAGSAR